MSRQRKAAQQAEETSAQESATGQPPANDATPVQKALEEYQQDQGVRDGAAAELAAALSKAVPSAALPQTSGGQGQPAAGTDASAPATREPGDEPEQSWVKRASVIVDPEAGVKFHFDYEQHRAVITFDEKPSAELLAVARPILRKAEFSWDGRSELAGWARRIAFATREDDRRQAKKAFYDLANAIRQYKGLPVRSFREMVPI